MPERFDRTVTHTLPAAGGASAERRVVDTQVWVPPADGPVPAVVFAHGIVGHPDRFVDLFTAWTDAGYAVIAPRFPKTAGDAPPISVEMALEDLKNQPADVKAALDDVLADVQDPDSSLYQRIDQTRLAIAGLSLGGSTALLSAYYSCCRDPRYSAVLAFSPAAIRLEDGGDFDFAAGPPLLLIHGDADEIVPYSTSVSLAERFGSRLEFVTLEGGAHSTPYEELPSPHDQLVRVVTTDFLDAVLKDDDGAMDRLVSAVAESESSPDGRARLQRINPDGG
jgi:dienelactone hydrolase